MAFRIKSFREDAKLQKYRGTAYDCIRSAILLAWWPPYKKSQCRWDDWLDSREIVESVNKLLKEDARIEEDVANVTLALYIDKYLEMENTVEEGHRFRVASRGKRMLKLLRNDMMRKS